MDALIVGAVVPQLANIFDIYWNSPHVYPVQTIISDRPHAGAAARALQRARRRRRPDDGARRCRRSTSWATGRSATTSKDGQLGLHWGKATAFADPPEKVTAMTDEEARR